MNGSRSHLHIETMLRKHLGSKRIADSITSLRELLQIFLCFMIQFIVWGIMMTLGLMMEPLAVAYHLDNEAVLILISIVMGMLLFVGPLGSILINKYGYRSVAVLGSVTATTSLAISSVTQNFWILLFTFSFGTGIGFGFLHLSSTAVALSHLNKYNSLIKLALGCGPGIGIFVFASVIKFIYSFGVAIMLLILSAVVSVCIVYSLFIDQPLQTTSDSFATNKSLAVQENTAGQIFFRININSHNPATYALKINRLKNSPSIVSIDAGSEQLLAKETSFNGSAMFSVIVLAAFLTTLGEDIPYVFATHLLDEKKIGKEDANIFISVIGIGHICGSVSLPYLEERLRISSLRIHSSCLIICGIATILSTFSYDSISYGIYCLFFGFLSSSDTTFLPAIIADSIPESGITNALGIVHLFQGIGTFVGSPISGLVSEYFQGMYDCAFYLSGMTYVASGVLFYLSSLRKSKCSDIEEASRNKSTHF